MFKGERGFEPGVYLHALRDRDTALPLAAATFGRLSLSMVPLGILIDVHRELGSYAVAGLITGVYAAGTTVGTPIWGRLMDRFGQRRVLLPTSVVSAACLSLLSLAVEGAVAGRRPLLLLLAFGAGLCYPPISPALRSSLRRLAEGPRRAALALDATFVELIFVAGPLLLSALLVGSWSPLPLIVTAALMVGGSWAYCWTPSAGPRGGLPAAMRPAASLWKANWQQVPVLTLTMFLLSCGFGLLDTSLAGTADRYLGGSDRVWMLFLAIAGGSVCGGILTGMRPPADHERWAIIRNLLCFAGLVGLVSGAVWVMHPLAHARPHPPLIGPLGFLLVALFAAGMTIAPTLITQQFLLARMVRHRMNLAQGLLTAANSSGVAVGTLAGGLLIDAHGVPWSVCVAGCAGVLAALLVTRVDCPKLYRGEIDSAVGESVAEVPSREPMEVPGALGAGV